MEEKDEQLIDQYLDGLMSVSEKNEFESKLAIDPILKEEYNWRILAREAVITSNRNELIDRLKNRQNTLGKKNKNWWWLWLAGLILVMGIILIFQNLKSKTDSNKTEKINTIQDSLPDIQNQLKTIKEDTVSQDKDKKDSEIKIKNQNSIQNQNKNIIDKNKLFAQAFLPYKGNQLRGEENPDTPCENPLDCFFMHYENQSYEKALADFDKMEERDKINNNFIFFKANCELVLGHFSTAANELKLMSTDSQSRYFREAHWYLALVYLKKGQLEESKSILKSIIADNKNPYKEEAENLLSRINLK